MKSGGELLLGVPNGMTSWKVADECRIQHFTDPITNWNLPNGQFLTYWEKPDLRLHPLCRRRSIHLGQG